MVRRDPTRCGTTHVLVWAMLLLAIPAGSQTSGGAGQPKYGSVKVGVIATTTGDFAQYGQPYFYGVQLAATHLKRRNEIDLQLTHRNTMNDPAENIAAIRDFASRGIRYVISYDGSPATLAAAPVAQANKVLLLSAATSIKVPEAGEWVWQGPTQTQPIAASGLVAAARARGLKRVAIMMDNNDYGVGTAKFVQSGTTDAGIGVVTVQAIDPRATDFTVQLNAVKAANPDGLIVVATLPGAALLVKQAREVAGLRVPILGPNSWVTKSFGELAGKAAEGAYAVTDFLPTADDSQSRIGQFTRAYREQQQTDANTFAAAGYDQVMLLFAAIQIAGGASDAAKVREAMSRVSLDGVTGTRLHFGPNRSIQKGLYTATWQGGGWTLVK
jgi:branched-chain amino acid transport system substrate-binding protein